MFNKLRYYYYKYFSTTITSLVLILLAYKVYAWKGVFWLALLYLIIYLIPFEKMKIKIKGTVSTTDKRD